jgi:hypothetical protein
VVEAEIQRLVPLEVLAVEAVVQAHHKQVALGHQDKEALVVQVQHLHILLEVVGAQVRQVILAVKVLVVMEPHLLFLAQA